MRDYVIDADLLLQKIKMNMHSARWEDKRFGNAIRLSQVLEACLDGKRVSSTTFNLDDNVVASFFRNLKNEDCPIRTLLCSKVQGGCICNEKWQDCPTYKTESTIRFGKKRF